MFLYQRLGLVRTLGVSNLTGAKLDDFARRGLEDSARDAAATRIVHDNDAAGNRIRLPEREAGEGEVDTRAARRISSVRGDEPRIRVHIGVIVSTGLVCRWKIVMVR